MIFKIYVGFWFAGRPSIYDLWADVRELRMQYDYNFDPLVPEARERWYELHPDRIPPAMTPKQKPRSRQRKRVPATT